MTTGAGITEHRRVHADERAKDSVDVILPINSTHHHTNTFTRVFATFEDDHFIVMQASISAVAALEREA